jgi:hypothetical protein
MLRIEKDCGACVTRLRLSGRIQSDHISSVESAMSEVCPQRILDLSEVTLVDLEVVRFLISCEDEGIELVQCPPYVREWIHRERAEGVPPAYSDAT